MKVICTAGTSVAQGVEWRGDEKAYRDGIRQRIQRLQPGDILRLASAETNSLAKLKITQGDEVALLHSETPDGRICAEEVARLAEKHFETAPTLREIAGLQVTDAQRFRRIGVQNLFSVLAELHSHRPDVVLNATGGFKAVVPYLTLYGLMHRLQVIYLFERSDSLITLPPAPVNFDYERLAQARDALLRLKSEGVMAGEAFFALIPGLSYAERSWYESLLEGDEAGHVTPSAFAMLLYQTLEREQATVFISPKALEVYQGSEGVLRKQFTRCLEKIGDPLWRQSKRHQHHQSELDIYKPGDVRMAAILRGDGVYVAELWPADSHGMYDREAERCQLKNYDLTAFTPWARPPDIPPLPETDEAFVREFEDTIHGLEKERDELTQLWNDAEDGLRQAQTQLRNNAAELDRLGARVLTHETELERLRRPWWKHLFGWSPR